MLVVRVWWVIALLASCSGKKETAPEPAHGSAPSSAPRPTTPAPIELLHSIDGTSVTVSSTVANPAHVPSHLVDGDLGTAWNSRTGDLVGTKLDVALPFPVPLTEIKLTAGFTSNGPKGEDWFTMNHRVRKVRVRADGKAAGDFELNTDKRDLQAFPLNVTAKTVSVEISEVLAGSKPNWREACISEFELWGRAGGAANAAKTRPRVSVAAPTSGASCPSKDELPKLITSASRVARSGKLTVHGCHVGKFGTGHWYITAAVDVPARKGEVVGRSFLIRSVFSASGTLVALNEDEGDAMHPWYWESVAVRDQNGDGVDEVIEELSGGGGVRRRNRDIYRVDGDRIERTASTNVGEYDPDGTFVPAE
jgi:hypothetical protein